jgi:hypothetical protein
MKTIKSIKATKNVEVGTIKRIGEKEADSEVKGGYWKYVPKSEYKSLKGKHETPSIPVSDNQTETEQTPNKSKKNSKKNS